MVGPQGQRFFLTWARPLAPVAALGAYAVLYLFDRDDAVLHMLWLLAASAAAGAAYAVAARRHPAESVLRIALPLDTLLIAGMTVALERPDVLAIAYLWSIAISALCLGPRDTVWNTVVAMACAAVVPILSSFGYEPTVVVTDVVVLGLIGAIFALFTRYIRTAQAALSRDRTANASALSVAERIRSSLDLEDVIRATVGELGPAVGAARTVFRRAEGPDGWPKPYEWHREGLEPYDYPEPAPVIQELFRTGEPIVVEDRAAVSGPPAAFLDAVSARSMVALPIWWNGRVAAVLGFMDDKPRGWNEQALPMLERVVPQVGAAIAQAELFEHQQATLDEFRELSRLREELVANVSHELRTPLTSTIGFLRTVQHRGDLLTPEQREKFLGLALSEAERLARLVDDLLDLARLERGVLALALGPVELDEVIGRARLGLDLDGRDLRVDLPPSLVARGDPDRLIQVFSNLLANAVRHGDGTISVAGGSTGRQVSVTICDGGPGIPTDRLSDLFVPFARWGSHSDSTGLGLAIARGVVHAHGGTLFYRPAASGGEHAFVVTLPRDGATPPPSVA